MSFRSRKESSDWNEEDVLDKFYADDSEEEFFPELLNQKESPPPFDSNNMKKLTTAIGADGNLYTVLQKNGKNSWIKLNTGSRSKRILALSRRDFYFDSIESRIDSYFPLFINPLDEKYKHIYRYFMLFCFYDRLKTLPNFLTTPQLRKDYKESPDKINIKIANRCIDILKIRFNNFSNEVYPIIDIRDLAEGGEYYENMLELLEADKLDIDGEQKYILMKCIARILKIIYCETRDHSGYFEGLKILFSEKLGEAIKYVFEEIYEKLEFEMKIIDAPSENLKIAYILFCMHKTGRLESLNCLIEY